MKKQGYRLTSKDGKFSEYHTTKDAAEASCAYYSKKYPMAIFSVESVSTLETKPENKTSSVKYTDI